jgi:hypothetical protein
MCKARGTLVIPKWKSAMFWPMIINRFTDNYQSYIKDLREYKNPQKFVQPGLQENTIQLTLVFSNSVDSNFRLSQMFIEVPNFVVYKYI